MNYSQLAGASLEGDTALGATLTTLSAIGLVPALVPALDAGIDAVGSELRAAVVDEIPEFSASGNPDILPEAERHARDHVAEIRRLFGGGMPSDFAFVKAHAARRAEQKFPLEATLHAYRCGHKVIVRWLRSAAVATLGEAADRVSTEIADFAIEYTDTISRIVAAEYVEQTRLLAEAEGDRRTELLSLLLSGYDEADGRVARLLRRAGYLEQRLTFCVAVAQPVDPREMDNLPRAQRLAEAVSKSVADMPIRTLVGIRDNAVIAIFSDMRRLSGWTAPQTALANRVHEALLRLGPAVLIGLSTDRPSTSHIPNALREARMAQELASVSQRVVLFSDLPLRRVLVHIAGDRVKPALPLWSSELMNANEASRGTLLETLWAFADADMNVQSTARALNVHPNTVYARMRRIEDLTGIDPQRFHALTELLLVADCSRQ